MIREFVIHRDCGGEIVPWDYHYVPGSFGDPPDPCCSIWACLKCGKEWYECQKYDRDEMAQAIDVIGD